MTAGLPYVIGQWVRGPRFYGRVELLRTLIASAGQPRWVMGTRRVGKTSVLRQLEHLTASAEHGLVPLVWDLQGADDPDELQMSFGDALLDADRRLIDLGFEPPPPEAIRLPDHLDRLAVAVAARGFDLLLLIDEAEELLTVAQVDPDLVARVGRCLVESSNLRCVLASSPRLAALPIRELSSSLASPLPIGALTTPEAEALIRQSHLSRDLRPDMPDDWVAAISDAGGGHPYLLQMLAKRTLERGDPRSALEEVLRDRAVAHFVEVDLQLLSVSDRAALERLASGSDRDIEDTVARRLCGLGLAREAADGLRLGHAVLEARLGGH